LAHKPQPMQGLSVPQFCLGSGFLSLELQVMNTFLLSGISIINLRGQALTQAPQPVHFALSIIRNPFSSTLIASNLQAATQSLKPTQPQEQRFGPSAIFTEKGSFQFLDSHISI